MSKQNVTKLTPASKPVSPNTAEHKVNIAPVHVLSTSCLAETCKKKIEKAGFCFEHFDWFKEGLITKEGRKPTDFEKKFFNYQQRRRPAA
jgi:hypothetical protein